MSHFVGLGHEKIAPLNSFLLLVSLAMEEEAFLIIAEIEGFWKRRVSFLWSSAQSLLLLLLQCSISLLVRDDRSPLPTLSVCVTPINTILVCNPGLHTADCQGNGNLVAGLDTSYLQAVRIRLARRTGCGMNGLLMASLGRPAVRCGNPARVGRMSVGSCVNDF